MPRYRYGGTMDAYAIGEDTASVPGATLAVLRAGVPVTFWPAKTGGVQYTTLLDLAGGTVTYVTSAGGGQLPEFDGPDGTGAAEVRQMWADGSGLNADGAGTGTGPRTLIQARVAQALALTDGVVRSINTVAPTDAGNIVIDAAAVGAATAGHGHQDEMDAISSLQAEVDTLPHPSDADQTITDRVQGVYVGATAISSGDANLATLLAAVPSWARIAHLPKS